MKKCHDVDPCAWQAWFDGSALPNPGKLGLGGVLRAPSGEIIQLSRSACFGDSTMGEYLALIMVLEQAALTQANTIVVHGDSRVVIDDVLGIVPVRRQDCTYYRLQVQELMAEFALATLIWIPRARNNEADALAKLANSQNCQVNV